MRRLRSRTFLAGLLGGENLPVVSPVIEALEKVAEQRNLPMAQIALAWVASNPVVTAPIVGASREKHLDDALAAVKTELTREEKEILEAPYRPHEVVGHR